jgi:predicted ArsR family transcriptional regulator
VSTPREWNAVELLAEPTRRSVYDAVRTAREPLTREAVAELCGITVRLAAFHLDRLAGAGLLDVDYARPPGRSGPGAGRPAKRYAAVGAVELAVPPRRYAVVAGILAAAVAQAPDDAAAAAARLARAKGRELGRELRRGDDVGDVEVALAAAGYEPASDGAVVRLRNCPFHDAVDAAPQLVCSLNHAYVEGLLTGLGARDSRSAHLDGVPPDCCVTVAERGTRRRGRGRGRDEPPGGSAP